MVRIDYHLSSNCSIRVYVLSYQLHLFARVAITKYHGLRG